MKSAVGQKFNDNAVLSTISGFLRIIMAWRAEAVANYLLEMASQRPTIIAGDFNRAIHTLEAWSVLRKRGFVDLQSHAHHIHGTPLPPTRIPRNCKNGGTRNDTFLVDPRLMPFLQKVDVLQTDDFTDPFELILHFQRYNCCNPNGNSREVLLTSMSIRRDLRMPMQQLHPAPL